MSSIARKQRRAMSRAFASTETGKKGAQALIQIATSEKIIQTAVKPLASAMGI